MTYSILYMTKQKPQKQVCVVCNTKKNLSEFYKHRSNKSGVYSKCKKCTINQDRFKRYGVTEKELSKLIDKQNNKCLICKQRLVVPQVDHCHKTKKIRGILCKHCNLGLGFFFDSKLNLFKAILYLSRIPT